jgi:hypothetical protein
MLRWGIGKSNSGRFSFGVHRFLNLAGKLVCFFRVYRFCDSTSIPLKWRWL